MLLSGACLAAIIPFFIWGSPSGHDFEFHISSWMEVLGQWKQGIIYPRWAAMAHWGYGEARFIFYPPGSWTLGAALGAVLPWKAVPGAYCWIVLTLAGLSMYRVARERLTATDALFAAMFYALNPYHLVIIYWRSAFAELLAAPLLPLVLMYLLRIFSPEHEDGIRSALRLSVTLTAAWLTNVPAAMMIHYSTAGLATVLVAREFFGNELSRRHIWRSLGWTMLAILLGAGLASFYLLPAIYEQGWVNISEVFSPGVRPQDNFLFTTMADPDHNRFNLLVSVIALAEILVLLVAMWFSRKKKDVGLAAQDATAMVTAQNSWIVFSAWGAGSALLMIPVTNLFWQHLPKLRFVQLPFRWLLCMNAALAMLLAMAAKRWPVRALCCAVLLTVVIVTGYRTQPPWWEAASDVADLNDAIADGTGYEGSDEYVPAGADDSELNKSLPLVSDDAGRPVRSEILEWGATEKHFVVQAPAQTIAPENVTAHVFSYPAWAVAVNGKPAATEKTELTGLIVIPMRAGDNDVFIYFRRTNDRLVGDFISLASLALLVIALIKSRRRLSLG
jgi:hypothetical protein